MFTLFKKDSYPSPRTAASSVDSFCRGFDVDDVKGFLQRVARQVDAGFGGAEIERVTALLNAMQRDELRELSFSIRFGGDDSVFRIRVFMDDIDAPDICFLAPPSLTESIRQEFERYTRELDLVSA
jgi:hypothetical protein